MNTPETPKQRIRANTPPAPRRGPRKNKHFSVTRQSEFCSKPGCNILHQLVGSKVQRDVVVTYTSRWICNTFSYAPYFKKLYIDSPLPIVMCKSCYWSLFEKRNKLGILKGISAPAALADCDSTLLECNENEDYCMVLNAIYLVLVGTVFLTGKPKEYVDCQIIFDNSTKSTKEVRTPPPKKRRLY